MKIRLGVRAYIYPLIVLAVCFFMYLHSRKAAASFRQERRPVAKARLPENTELNGTADMNLPALYLFGSQEEIAFAAELRSALEGKCSVMHIQSSGDDVRGYFGIRQVPCAILFNQDRDKLASFEPLPEKGELLDKVMKQLAAEKIQ